MSTTPTTPQWAEAMRGEMADHERAGYTWNERDVFAINAAVFKQFFEQAIAHAPPLSPPTDDLLGSISDVVAGVAKRWIEGGFIRLDPNTNFSKTKAQIKIIDEITSALAPLSQREPGDSELLDWLDRNRYMVDFNNEGTELNGPGHWQCTDGDHWGTGLHIRAAIKSAMRGEGKP